MNRSRRKELEKIAQKIEELEGEISAVRDEEEEAFDNMPESFQDGERGYAMQEAIDEIYEIVSELEDLRARMCGL